MSTVAEIKAFDPVFDAQKHYRTLLQSTARPGTIGQLDDTTLEVPPQLNRSTSHILMALLSADCTFYVDQAERQAIDFIQRETSARQAEPEQADFLIMT